VTVEMNSSNEDRRWPPWRRALVMALLLRAAYSLLAAVFALIQPVNGRLLQSNALTENLPPPEASVGYLLFGVWERFDTLWYLHIAGHGYDRADAVVFFPLYPSLVKIASLLIPPIAAALLISTVAAFFLFWGLQELLLGDDPQDLVNPDLVSPDLVNPDLVNPDLVNQCVLLCAAWPASFIFFAGYPESLLFALIAWSLCMARRGGWWAAAVLGLAAALTKAVGVVVAVPLVVMAVRHRNIKALPVLLVPLGLAGFLGYLHWNGHGALVPAYGQYWRTSAALPWTTLWASVRDLIYMPNPILALNLIFLLSVSAFAVLSRMRVEYLLYSAAAIVVFLCKETTPPLQSMMRYLLIIFPAFVGFARLLQGPRLLPRFWMVCACLFLVNVGLLWLFLGWSLVV
jgi:hypothetical protein